MFFSLNSNLSAMQAYNALAETNNRAQKAQLRLASTKKINSVADNTSGYRVGKSLESKNAILKAQLNNASSAKNYLSIAESALENVDALLGSISSKYVDAQDSNKNKAALADDIRALANEIDVTLKSTTYNGRQLLTKTDGSSLDSSDQFDLSGESKFTVDFAGTGYLKADDLKSILHGGGGTLTKDTPTGSLEGAHVAVTSSGDPIIANNGPSTTSEIKVTFADDTEGNFTLSIGANATAQQVFSEMFSKIYTVGDIGGYLTTQGDNSYFTFTSTKKITSITTTSGFDAASYCGIKYGDYVQSGSSLLSSNDDEVLSVAGAISGVSDNVKNAIGRLGNLSQMVETRSEYISSSISNNNSSISRLFDADMAEEQLNVIKHNVAGQVATNVLLQLNQAPQTILSLFR